MVGQFLRQVLRLVPGKLLVIWDGAPIHRAQPLKDFLRTPTGRRVHLEVLPAYAPELNPVSTPTASAPTAGRAR